jgi:subtilisin family serine protease
MKLTKTVLTFLLLTILSISLIAQSNVIKKDDTYYFADRVVVKLKQTGFISLEGKVELTESVKSIVEKFGVTRVEQKYKIKKAENKEAAELNKIVTMFISASIDPELISAKLSKSDLVEWAEPHYLYQLAYTPNDPNHASQYAISKIQSEAAWDINKGDSSIIIAIDDTGVDWDHPDLAANIWVNDDPVNGIDSDGNGYIDDINGWDFGGLTGTPDNDPKEDRPDHGTHVAGISSAVTDNGVGVSSIGFNCTIMPVKTSQDNIRNDFGQALIAYGYEGIVYAADNGAHVINCSWGGFNYSIAAKAAIDYAISQGTLVVGAAGNNGISTVIYPAAYPGVLSVGSTTSSDTRSSFSNYGMFLDVLAPGSSIYNTWQNDTYATLSGTSMASPLAAGLAGLVFSQFPSYTPLQVAEQIRVNADNIDAQNSGFSGLLGSGRINAFKALSNAISKSVRMVNHIFIDEGDGDGIFEPGENVSIEMNFVNYLNATSGLTISIETTNGHVTINNSSFSAGAVAMLDEFNNSSNKFSFTLSPSVPFNTDINFKINYTDGAYEDFQWISIRANPTYSTQSGNNITLTLTSKGALGFDDYSSNTRGEGFKFIDGPNLMFEGAFLYGTSPSSVMDAARISSTQSTDFSTVQPLVISVPGDVADQQGLTIFNDDGAGGGKLGIETELISYSYAATADENYIILKYKLTNKTTSAISGVRAGLFFDWDLLESTGDNDLVGYDVSDEFGYAYHQGGNPDTYVGAAVLSSSGGGFRGIRNDGSSGGINIYDNFSDAEKWTALSSGIQNTSLPAGDISYVVSAAPLDIDAGGSAVAAFAIAAGNNLEDLRTAIQAGRAKYNTLTDVESETTLPIEFNLAQNYPNPFNPSTKINFSIPESGLVSLKIYDLLGREVAELINTEMQPGTYDYNFNGAGLSSGMYFYKIEAGSYSQTRKMMLLK